MWDILNEGIPHITYFVVLHAFPQRSIMLLTFSRHQMMNNIFCVVSCAEVTC